LSKWRAATANCKENKMVVCDAKGPCRGISICAATAGHRTHLAATAPVSLQRPAALEQRKMEVCPIGRRPHSDVSPRERLQRGMQPSLTAPNQPTSTPSPLAVKTAWESPATYGSRCFHHAILDDSHVQTVTPVVLILPRSERSRNATSPVLRICLCARTDCVSLRTGSEIDWILPLKGTPESCHGSRFLARHGQGKVLSFTGNSGKITQGRLPRVLGCRLPVF
jgi:hypothetical protein